MALTVPTRDQRAVPGAADEVDYGPLVVGALSAAGVVLAGNAVVTVLVANLSAVTTEIRLLWSVVPYVALVADAGRFASVTSLATLVGAVALAGWLVASAAGSSLDRLAKAGRLSAVPMAAAMIALQWARLAGIEVADDRPTRWLGVATLVLVAGGVLATWLVRQDFVEESPLSSSPAPSVEPEPRTAPEPEPETVLDLPDTSAAVGASPATGFRRNLRTQSQETLR